jgi:hypothetical protein
LRKGGGGQKKWISVSAVADLLRRSPLRAVFLVVSVGFVGGGIAFLLLGKTFAGVWLLAMGVLTAPLNAYRLSHPLRDRPRERSEN